jgi:hypothetical protein
LCTFPLRSRYESQLRALKVINELNANGSGHAACPDPNGLTRRSDDYDLCATHDIEGHDERANQCTDHERYGANLRAGKLERAEPNNRGND